MLHPSGRFRWIGKGVSFVREWPGLLRFQCGRIGEFGLALARFKDGRGFESAIDQCPTCGERHAFSLIAEELEEYSKPRRAVAVCGRRGKRAEGEGH